MKKKLLLICILVISVCFVVSGCDDLTTISVKITGKNCLEKEYQVSEKVIKNIKNYPGEVSIETIKKINIDMYNDIVKLINIERVEPIDATLQFDKDKENAFTIKDGINGVKVNENKFYNDIIDSLYSKNIILSLSYEIVEPEVKKEDIIKQTSFRSEYTTYYKNSSDNRKNNIKVATSKINGSIIAPKSKFSFNNVVGKRSIENGFKNSIIISNGKFVEGVGGGVCQVSTTLYNSFLFGGLNIVEARQHSLPVSYTSPSTDCMVSSWSDLVVENTSDYPIYILGKADNEKVNFKVYGMELGYSIKRESKVTEVVPYKTIVSDTEERKGKNGIKSYAKLIYYRNDREFFSEIVRNDYYLPQDEIILAID